MSSTQVLEKQNQFVSGYDVTLEDPAVRDGFQCKICKKILRDPIQTCRGELACGVCYRNALMESCGMCPIDNQPISETEYFNDKFKANEVLNLRCLCNYVKAGCDWIGELRYTEKHLENCTYRPLDCPFCHEQLLINEDFNRHIIDCQIILSTRKCFYEKYGCRAKITNKEDYIKHLQDDATLHLMLQGKALDDMQSDNNHMRNQMDTLKNEVAEIANKMAKEIERLSEQLSLLQKSKPNMETHSSQLPAMQSSLNTIPSENRTVSYDVSALSLKMEGIGKKLSDMDLQQQLQENATYNGKLIWKIDNFKHRMEEAILGKVTALHSAPCFTEKYGYKFCGRLYLNGDGMGKCTHMSLFLAIMKSEYDNLLAWPFTKRVSFRLINQEDKSKSICESFLPDSYSSSFQKPKTKMNVAAGCPMFVSKEELDESKGFVKDDTIFVEIIVE